MMNYLWNILISVDQFIAVVLSPILNLFIKGEAKFGDPDETISSVLGKNIKENKCPICKGICFLLDLLQKGHCIKSIEKDEGSAVV